MFHISKKKLYILFFGVILLFCFNLFYYFKDNNILKSKDILAHNDSRFNVIFDASYGSGWEYYTYNGDLQNAADSSIYAVTQDYVIARKVNVGETISQPDRIESRLVRNGRYVSYWSKNYDCSTRDLGLNEDFKVSGYTVYYACYEETNFNNNGIRYVQENAYVSGDNVVCGDMVKITSCYRAKGSSKIQQYCEFNAVKSVSDSDFKSASGVVYRNSLGVSSKVCESSTYVANFNVSSIVDGEEIKGTGINCSNGTLANGVCTITSDSTGKVKVPDTSSLNYKGYEFIGWAWDSDADNKININCSGDLVTSKTIRIVDDATYYACYDIKEDCETTERITNVKGEKEVKVCYNSKKSKGTYKLTAIDDDYDEIVTCASGYELSDISKTNVLENTCTKTGDCYKVYELNCEKSESERPKVTVTPTTVRSDGYGTINFNITSNASIKGYYASRNYLRPTTSTHWIIDTRGKYTLESTPGNVFIWGIDYDNSISYAAMATVFDNVNSSTTLKSLEVETEDGKKINPEIYAFQDDSLISHNYVRLSNKLNDDSKILASAFNPYEMAYKLKTNSSKIAVYATLTSSDAKYVPGYEPRTVELDYGINTILIQIEDKKGNIRTYTILVTREDNRSSNNLLKNLSVSSGKISFDPFISDYVVTIGKNKDSVSINGILDSATSSFVDGFGPRKIKLTGNETVAVLKVMSETGSVRSYTIKFIKSDEELEETEEAILSSLSLSKAYISFDSYVYEYNTSVEYDVDYVDVYALPFNGGDSLKLYKVNGSKIESITSRNISLDVGYNNIVIEVSSVLGKTRKYYINILRKEDGLDVSNDTSLSMLSVKGYNIDFDPNQFNYQVKIKRERTLVIAATPNNNRSEIYIRGNKDLTAFSIVKVKVVSEDGQFREYTIDILKDAYNKKIEYIAIFSAFVIIVCGIIVLRIKKRKRSLSDYYS